MKIVYICSYHQNPTGLTLAEERRPRVLEIVRRYSTGHRILVLEDAAYRELTYEGRPPRSLRSFDPRGDLVALAGTFSKPFAPGVKTGYVLLPRDLAAPVLLAKGNQDFGSANLCQHLLHAALSSGVYDRHVQALCQAYRAKRDALLESLDRCLGDLRGSGAAGWTRPGGGLYVYLTLPPDVDASRTGPLFARALEAGVLYVPGEYCHPADPTRRVPRNTLRLSFGVPTVDQIRSGVERLGHAIRAAPRSVAAR